MDRLVLIATRPAIHQPTQFRNGNGEAYQSYNQNSEYHRRGLVGNERAIYLRWGRRDTRRQGIGLRMLPPMELLTDLKGDSDMTDEIQTSINDKVIYIPLCVMQRGEYLP
jgi:hypothetical protein